MSEIQRWSPSNEGTFEYSDGRYVLYTDHLAALAEKDESIKGLIVAAHRYEDEIERRGERIAALKIRNDKITLTIGDWVTECDALKEQIAALTATLRTEAAVLQKAEDRIKELEANVTYWKSQFEGRGVE
jgi:chromosome segregation ATPase